MLSSSPFRPPRRQAGTSLVEVLVALLLLTVGLLTMAGLHASSLKLTKVSQFKTSASEIAQVYGDAARSNVAAAITGGYNRTVTGGAIVAPNPPCTAPAVACTPAQIAATDLFNARTMAAALPNGDIFASVNAGNVATTVPSLSVWVYWSSPDSDEIRTGTDQARWDSSRERRPAAVSALAPRRQCLEFTIPL